MGEYCEDLESIMLQIGIPLQTPDTSSCPHLSLPFSASPTLAASPAASSRTSLDTYDGTPLCGPYQTRHWTDCTADYQYLLMRFRELRHRTECLNSAVTGLASISGNRQAYKEQQLALQTAKRSIREAKSNKAVTLLGLVFIPLAYTSQLFSMADPYGPAGQQFWIYFATALPLIVVVIGGFYVLDFGYTNDGTSWSFDTFRATVKTKTARLRSPPKARPGSAEPKDAG